MIWDQNPRGQKGRKSAYPGSDGICSSNANRTNDTALRSPDIAVSVSLGEHRAILMAFDNNNNASWAWDSITVLPNPPPTASAGADQTAVWDATQPLASATLDGSASYDRAIPGGAVCDDANGVATFCWLVNFLPGIGSDGQEIPQSFTGPGGDPNGETMP